MCNCHYSDTICLDRIYQTVRKSASDLASQMFRYTFTCIRMFKYLMDTFFNVVNQRLSKTGNTILVIVRRLR